MGFPHPSLKVVLDYISPFICPSAPLWLCWHHTYSLNIVLSDGTIASIKLPAIYIYILCDIFQDDYLDCFGDPEITGKVGTDIEDNKCSWLVIQALRDATPEQMQALQVSQGLSLVKLN